MSRQYNRRDYSKVNPYSVASSELRGLEYNVASTINARIKALRNASEFEQATSELAVALNRMMKNHPNYFTKNGTIKKRTAKMSDQQVRDMLDDILSLTQKKTVKQSAKAFEKAMGEKNMKELRARYHRDKKAFEKEVGEEYAKIIENQPSDPDDENDVEEFEVVYNDEPTERDKQIAALAYTAYLTKKYNIK